VQFIIIIYTHILYLIPISNPVTNLDPDEKTNGTCYNAVLC